MALRAQRWAVAAIFVVHGAVSGTFAARIPAIAEHLHLSPGTLGIALVAPAAGSLSAMPLTGRLIHRIGARAATRVLIALFCLALALPALAPSLPVLFLTLVLCGASAGTSDIAMNAQGSDVEQRMGLSIMSGLHGMWSVGGFVAAGIAALAVQAGVSAPVHLAVMAAVLLAVGQLVGPALPPSAPASTPRPEEVTVGAGAASSGVASAGPTSARAGAADSGVETAGPAPAGAGAGWSTAQTPEGATVAVAVAAGAVADGGGAIPLATERPRFSLPTGVVLVIGLIGFCAIFGEAGGQDWSAIYMRDVMGSGHATAALTFGVFAGCMALTRLLGDRVIRRFGPVVTIRASALTAVAGGLLIAGAFGTYSTIAGFGLIGIGVAVAVPLVFAAAGRIGGARGHAAAGNAIAAVATIAYGAGLATPGAIGGLADLTSLRWAFLVVTVLVAIIVPLGGALDR